MIDLARTEKPQPGLETSAAVSDSDTEALWQSRSGPFCEGLRIACPIKLFGRRKTSFCFTCPHFVGVGTRIVIGEVDDNNPAKAGMKYTIWCAHPVARGVRYFPED